MQFDEHNPIVKLCAKGMDCEGQGNAKEASELFYQAWNEASTDLEKFIAAHYVARHQEDVADKLKWDERALNFALKVNDGNMKGTYSSLYLNIGKCYEDLGDPEKANDRYRQARAYSHYLKDDGYGKMIGAGIKKGIDRTSIRQEGPEQNKKPGNEF